jgi:uncharacterized protein (TIGR02996 family)
MSTTTDRDGLLRDVIARADEDTPRLILADWYDEHDDPERAEFIRLQIQRSHLDNLDPEAWRLNDRIGRLSGKHQERWMAELPRLEGIRLGGFERGLPAWAKPAPPSAWPRHEEAVFAAAPINRLEVLVDVDRGEEPFGSCLLRCRQLHRIRRLHLVGMAPARALDLPALAACPDLEGLRELDISEGGHEDDLLEALGQCRGWPRLEKLRLYRGWFTVPGWEALASTPVFGTLRDLDVHRSNLGHAGLLALLASPHLPDLRSLNLCENNLHRGSVRALLEHDWPGLEHLDLSCNEIGDAAVRMLARTKHLPQLRSLNLGINNFSDRALADLAKAGWSLRSLDIGPCTSGTKGLKALARAPWLPGLVALDLFGTELSPEAVRVLAAAPWTGLRRLHLTDCNLDDAAVFALLEAPWLGNLLDLDLGENAIGEAGATALLADARLDGLLQLSVRKNRFPAALGERFRERFGDRVILKTPWD